jgi:hypothetical protein
MLARVPSAPASVRARLLPHGWFDLARQFLLFAAAYYGYSLVRGAVDSKAAAAFQHARELISVERTLHVFVEPSIQAWASGSHLLIVMASWVYLNAQTSVTLGALVFLYLFRNSSFYFVRNMFMVAMLIALVGYTVFPTAPPRLMPEWGFYDSLSDYTGIPSDNASLSAFFNQYAAVPSMHVGFAVMIGVVMARVVRRKIYGALWLAYPLLVTFATVATANHFLADAVLGALTAAAAAYAARWLARTRPHVWDFSTMTSTAEAGAAA